MKAKLEEAQRRSTTFEIDESEMIKAFDYGRQLLISGELPQLHQLVNLYIDEVTVYPDFISVKLNMINGIQANSNSEELERLWNIDKEASSSDDTSLIYSTLIQLIRINRLSENSQDLLRLLFVLIGKGVQN